MAPLLEVRNCSKRFPIEGIIFKTKGFVEAVRNVSFSVQMGEVVALVGESGSGKSTIGKMVQGLIKPTSGEIFFNGENAESISRKKRAGIVQTIFQDPYASLNPKLSVGTMLKEAINQKAKSQNLRETIVNELLESVGLSNNILNNYPHQFSGGQKQRLGIARALTMNPKLIIADEPVSALDLSVQAQILNLLMDLKEKFGVSYLLIAHDLAVVKQLADKVLILYNGAVIEEGSVEKVFCSPQESYTKRLLSAIEFTQITIDKLWGQQK